jgi:hypothetical protein
MRQTDRLAILESLDPRCRGDQKDHSSPSDIDTEFKERTRTHVDWGCIIQKGRVL